VRILLDENLPRKVVAALRSEGHAVESIHTLKMQGLDNRRLYEFATRNFDLCFTRDFGFIHNVRQGQALPPFKFKLLRVVLAQKPQDEFVADLITEFRRTDLNRYQHGDDWP
jgi:predicted nuclease of predicted toxin-antitoxin system